MQGQRSRCYDCRRFPPIIKYRAFVLRRAAAFQLLGPDEDSVRQFMNASRQKAFMAHPTMRLEVDGDSLLIMKPHFRLDAENVRTYMSEALAATQIMIGPSK